ncbi:MAG: tRNA (N(6)-L-threonylcarbamoyladenosine(37)-C(2))-methylthiotransferase MtaB [Eubacteriales bacterium]
MNFSIYTLGCKVNQYESQAMAQLLTQKGFSEVDFSESADLYIINTCTVTALSDKKSRQMIRKAKKTSPNSIVAVCGCYSQKEVGALDDLPIDILWGTGERAPFLAEIEGKLKGESVPSGMDNPFERTEFEVLPSGGVSGRTRGLLKVQDGCQNFCTYCIIPYTRGKLRSISVEDGARELQSLVKHGYQEVILTGIELSSWGVDLEGAPPLLTLLQGLDSVADGCKLRLGSLEPRTITEEFCKGAVGLHSLCPQFHLSLQSGSDSVLKRMNRKYTTERYLQSVSLLRQYFPSCGITTDLIVGFPQESEEEFCETLEFLQNCQFASMHVFPYSSREGTAASNMEGQISKEVKEERAKRATTIAREMQFNRHQSLVGTVQEVLFEVLHHGHPQGHSLSGEVVLYEKPMDQAQFEGLQNERRLIQITSCDQNGLLGLEQDLQKEQR